MSDGFSRGIRYLRLSVTDRCNFRCGYCVPERGVVFRSRDELMTFEEIERLLGIFVGMGIERVRLTGGEPTVRAGLVELVARLARIELGDGRRLEVVMTSNGHRLAGLAPALANAGLRGINISLDTLDPDRFRALTRRGDLASTVAGIEAAIAAGLAVKLNIVAMKGRTEGEIAALCEFAWDRGILPRFIEHMPIAEGCLYSPEDRLHAVDIRARLERHLGVALVADEGGAEPRGPARYWHVAGLLQHRVGMISAMSDHFCASCNRLRVTATGDLHACLAYDEATNLLAILRSGGDDPEVEAAIRGAVTGKRAGHEFTRERARARKPMIAIGG